jgi:hypothetical protein
MPRPYLAFNHHQSEQLYRAATESSPDCTVLECPSCGRRCRIEQFGNRDHGRGLDVFENGDFVADCPHCGRRRKWHLDDAIGPRPARHFPAAFRDGFCDAVAQGLPLRCVGRMRYLGLAKCGGGKDRRAGSDDGSPRLGLRPHMFACESDRTRRAILLPRNARVDVEVARTLEPGEVFALALSEPAPSWWRKLDRWDRWATAERVCGGKHMLEYLQMLWFESQAISFPIRPDVLLYPADLVCLAVRVLPPQGLWWDFDAVGALNLVDMDLEAVLFPPLRLRRWDQFSLGLPGEVAIDAGVGDTRFSATGVTALPRCARKHARVARPQKKASRPKARASATPAC